MFVLVMNGSVRRGQYEISALEGLSGQRIRILSDAILGLTSVEELPNRKSYIVLIDRVFSFQALERLQETGQTKI